MLSEIEEKAYFEAIRLCESGRRYVSLTMRSKPSRSVTEGGYQNQSSLIYSEKMGFTIQAESGTGEYASCIAYEYEDEVIGMYDQTPKVKVRGVNAKGKPASWWVRADYLVLTKSGVEIHEVKADSFIEDKLAKGHPAWRKGKDGMVHYIPAEEYFAALGIKYIVKPISSFNKILLSNQKLLLSSRVESFPDDQLIKSVKKNLTDCFSMTMEELMQKVGIDDTAPLVRMVDQRMIFCELEKEFLTDDQNVHLALNKELSGYARRLREDSDMCLNMIGAEIDLPSKKHAEDALYKLEKIQRGETGRSIRRWRQLIDQGERNGLSPFQSLLTKLPNSGNRDERFEPVVVDTFLKAVDEFYATPKRLTVSATYLKYQQLASEEHPEYEPMSESTFYRRIKRLDPMKLAQKRGGKRSMHANSPTSKVEDRILKSQVAFQKGHIDHNLVKCYIVWAKDGHSDFIDRPSLSLLIDEASDLVLGYHFSFAKPSRMAISCTFRDCVRRFGKLPEEIFSDHGPDFKSVYNRALLASERVTLSFRPKSCSKAGSEVERFFNEFKTTWLVHREGNTVDKHAIRAIDGKFNSKNFAVLQPEDLLREFEQFVSWRNNKLRGSRTETASFSFNRSQKLYGYVGRKIAFDPKFLVASAVDARAFTIERNDVKIDGIRYSHPDLSRHKHSKTKVEVRVEPENPYIVYAYVNRRWISCVATGAIEFAEKSNLFKRVETLKIRGAGTLRLQARNASRKRLADELVKADRQLLESQNTVLDECSAVKNVRSEHAKEDIPSIFDEIMSETVTALPTSKWSVQ
ncbi:MAG: Mu transposase C-terminal domain-containing protein [Oleiphilaceae bacterium]|nr:Mu transposase C-terminal domain-containing protein [Oleiphilaceae bacterium]